MASLILHPEVVAQIEALAKRENMSVDELMVRFLNLYSPVPAMRTESEVLDLMRQDRLRMYERARRYWRKANDTRQDMTDDQLDELFWMFDSDGIPRLKSEQGSVHIEPNTLLEMRDRLNPRPPIPWELRHNNWEHTKEILNIEYTDYLLARNHRPAVPRDDKESD